MSTATPKTFCVCVSLSVLLAGCPALFGAEDTLFEDQPVINLSIETEETIYEVKEDQPLEISYTYRNQGPDAAYLGTCLTGFPSYQLEKLINGEWVAAYLPACNDILGFPLKIGPGENYKTTLHLVPADWDPNPRNATWHGGDDIAGTYRVPELVYSEWSRKQFDEHTLPPPEMVYSNTFEIRKQP